MTAVHADKRAVTVRRSSGEEYVESYDALLLTPGAKPIKPLIPGIDSERIFMHRNIPDTDRIKAYVEERGVKRSSVIEGGVIGIEMAENLLQRGIEVTLIGAAPHILAPFDTDMADSSSRSTQKKRVKIPIMIDRGKTNGEMKTDTLRSDKAKGAGTGDAEDEPG